MNPLIKWTGSKRGFFNHIPKEYLPGHVSTVFDAFCGGMSASHYLSGIADRIVASDIIPELIGLYYEFKNNPDKVIKSYRLMWSILNSLQKSDRPDYYYKVRRAFNVSKSPYLFNFITRTSYNGLVRYNSRGDFNAPFHHNRGGIAPDKLLGIVREWHPVLLKSEVRLSDYRDSIQYTKSGDFVFLDPPYQSSNSIYTESKTFDYDALFREMDRLNSVGVKWMLTLGENNELTPPRDVFTVSLQVSGGISHYRAFKGVENQTPKDRVWINYASN